MEAQNPSGSEYRSKSPMNDRIATSAARETALCSLVSSVPTDDADTCGKTDAAPIRSTVAVLTGGGDRPYALGLAATLIAQGIAFDFIASDELEVAELRTNPLVRFLNLRKEMHSDVSLKRKVLRVLLYYGRLLAYAATAKPKLFHILWNNKFALLDRTLLMLYYRALGKRIVLTAHNVNAGQRNSRFGGGRYRISPMRDTRGRKWAKLHEQSIVSCYRMMTRWLLSRVFDLQIKDGFAC